MESELTKAQHQAVTTAVAAQKAAIKQLREGMRLQRVNMEACGLPEHQIAEALLTMQEAVDKLQHSIEINSGRPTVELPIVTPKATPRPGTSWAEHDGVKLQPFLKVDAALGGAPVRLVHAKYLVEIASKGELLQRRQDMPENAFLPLDELWGMHDGVGGMLRILVISHPWLQPDHPDPRGENLRLLARALGGYLALRHTDPGIYGVFLDYCSLPQKGRGGEERTDAEAALFGRALGGLSEFYCHPHTTVFRLTRLPANYPLGFHFPSGSTPNTAYYVNRGWCFTEAAVSGLVKDGRFSLDLALLPPGEGAVDAMSLWSTCKMQRKPPLTPDEFSRQLATKSFTSKKSDLPTVNALYRKAFDERVVGVGLYNFSDMGWQDEDALQLAHVLASGALRSLTHIDLNGNRIGDTGLLAILDALEATTDDGVPISPKLVYVGVQRCPASSAIAARFSSKLFQARAEKAMLIAHKAGWW